MLDRIVSPIAEGLVALDRDLRYVYVNDAAERLTGLSRAESLGRRPEHVLPAEAAATLLPQLTTALATGQPAVCDVWFTTPSRCFEHRLYPSPDGVTVLFADVTERRRSADALRRREEMQALLVSLLEQVRNLRDPDDVVWTCVCSLGSHLRVDRCMFGEVDPDHLHLRVARDYVDGIRSAAGVHRLEDFGTALTDDVRAGRTFVIHDTHADRRLDGVSSRAAFDAIEARAAVLVPLVKAERLVALLSVQQSAPRDWSEHEIALLERVAEQTWFAVANARAEAALRESRDVLALAMRGGRMGAWSRNLSTGVVWWSRELEEIFGLPPGGFSGTEAGFFSFVHPDDRPQVESAVAAAIRSHGDYVVEFRFRTASGQWRWMDGRGRAVYGDDGASLWLYGLAIDITERKEAEAALAAARADADADAARLHLAMAAARLGDWSWDAHTDLVTFSPRFAEIFGIPADQPMTWTQVRQSLHPDDRERARRAVEAAVETRGDYAIEYRLLQGERERWISARGRPRFDPTGLPLGMHGVVQDVSHDRLLVHLDDAVRGLATAGETTSRAARILGEYLGADRCGYATVDADGECAVMGAFTNGVHGVADQYRLESFGTEFGRLWLAGQPVVVVDVMTDERLSAAERAWYEAASIRGFVAVPILKAGRLEAGIAVSTVAPRAWQSHEVSLVQQVASRCWELVQRVRAEEDRAALLARERLARLEAEQQNRRLAQLSEAAEAASRSKDEFMAMLGHELRNPLAPILTALQLMRLRGDTGSDRERVVIERQVKHLTRLVDDLLDVSRIARGKVELKLAPVEAAEVIARAIEMASPLLEARTHTLAVDVPRTGLPMLVDAARLSQVVSNLLTNAARYTAEGGTISVIARRDRDEVLVSVRDTGIGIAPEVLPTVFDLFVQGRQASNRAEGGLGLGLAIVRNLVERHGGRVLAHSEGIGRGSEFSVWVPLAPVVATPEQPRRLPLGDRFGVPPAHVSRVLIVDDNQDAADMLAHVLSSRGHDTRVAHDGVQALRACADFAPHAAFLDLGLPVMDGYELASRLRELPGLRDIRLIAVTGYGQESDRRRTQAAGFQHHLVKPVDISAIEALLA
jgi:PAS domain S-box-containing protein